MEKVNTNAGNVRLVGERLCLDFCNTVADHHQESPKDYLLSYVDLVLWSQHSGALGAAEAAQLVQTGQDQPDRASVILERARRVRTLLYRLFSALAQGEPVQATDLALLNRMLAETPARTAVLPTGQGFTWQWAGPAEALDRMLWPVIWSAAQLLTSAELARVKQCEGAGCSWLFLDTSRSRSRRWCSMQDCGNRAKVNRHYRRHQATQ